MPEGAFPEARRVRIRNQRFLTVAEMSMLVSPEAFVFLSARFSFNDFPDFLVMELRGDLSDIAGDPILRGPRMVHRP